MPPSKARSALKHNPWLGVLSSVQQTPDRRSCLEALAVSWVSAVCAVMGLYKPLAVPEHRGWGFQPLCSFRECFCLRVVPQGSWTDAFP